MIEFRYSDFFYPISIFKTMRLLKQSESWPKEKFDAYQRRHLVRLLKYSIRDVPYYSSLFKTLGVELQEVTEANVWHYFAQIPILDKDTLQNNPQIFNSRKAQKYRPKLIATSGTTGTPLPIYWDKGSNVMEFCSIQRLWRWAGFWPGQPFLDLRSRGVFDEKDPHYVHRNKIGYLHNWKIRGLEFSSDMINAENIDKYYQVLLKHRPRLVRGHPQSIQHFAQLLRDSNLEGWKPSAVTTASEMLYDFQRNAIMDAWHIPILDSYGIKEHNVFITQCREGQYHIYPEYGVCEIVDDEGRPVDSGQECRIVATGLHNYAQVLLRYDTRDRAVAGTTLACRCGCTLPVIQRLIGRIDDCLYSKEGHCFSGFSFAFLDRKGIRKGRLVQENYSEVRVELVATEAFSEEEQKLLLDDLSRKVQNKMTFRVNLVEDIRQEKKGKFKFVISKVRPAQP